MKKLLDLTLLLISIFTVMHTRASVLEYNENEAVNMEARVVLVSEPRDEIRDYPITATESDPNGICKYLGYKSSVKGGSDGVDMVVNVLVNPKKELSVTINKDGLFRGFIIAEPLALIPCISH